MDRSVARRRLLVGGALTLVIAVAAVGVALATPKSGPARPATSPSGTASSTTLADGNTVNTVNINVDPIKLRTKDSVEVFQVSNTADPGWTSGWHKHTGPVIVNVTAGALTFYEADCTVTTVTAPGAFIETTGHPIVARNEGSVAAAWITTQIIPVGASHRVDVTPGFCGVS